MWMLSVLPNWVFHCILVLGIVLYIGSIVLKYIPSSAPYNFPTQLVAVCLMIVGIWYEGGIAKDTEYRIKDAAYQLKLAEMATKVANAETQAATASAQLVASLMQKDNTVIAVQSSIRDNIKGLAAQINKGCVVAPEAITLLNGASINPSKGSK